MRAAPIIAAATGLLASPAFAEIVRLDRAPIPPPFSMDVLATVVVSGTADAPAEVEIHDDLEVLRLQQAAEGSGSLQEKLSQKQAAGALPEGVHLSLISAESFHDDVDKENFCCARADASTRDCAEALGLKVARGEKAAAGQQFAGLPVRRSCVCVCGGGG